MIQERDAEQVSALPEPAGEDAILLAGGRIAGGVVVDTDPGHGIHQNQRFEQLAWMHDGQRQGADGDDVDADDGCLASSPQTRSSRSSPAKSGLRMAAAATEVVNGDEGGTARLSRTSVTRYRGTAYSFLGFGCRIRFKLPCEP